jgi:hypothetical protein
VAGLRVFTPFINLVHAFGLKTSDEQRFRDTVYQYISEDPEVIGRPLCFGNQSTLSVFALNDILV